MSTFTANLNLEKPNGAAGGDLVDVGVLNANADKIDATAKPPFVALRRAATQSIPSGAPTSIIWDTEDEDPLGFHAAASTNIVIPAGQAGVYLIALQGGFQNTASGGLRSFSIFENGVSIASAKTNGVGIATTTTFSVSILKRLAVGAIITGNAYQDSGGALDIPVDARIELIKLSL